MSNDLSNLISELQKIADDAKATFGNLSAAQINWRPTADGWSVGQCFEHMIKTNELFYGDLDKIGAGARKNSLIESFSPLTGFFGNFLINSLKKDERKFKVPTQKIAPPSEIDEHIIEIFAAHQSEIIGKIRLTGNVDWKKTVVTSPFMKLATYSLADGYRVIVEHEKRHIRQAERVMNAEGFPR